MQTKLLLFYSRKQEIHIPQNVTSNFQTKIVPISYYEIKKTVPEFQPQVIIVDEFVNLKFIKKILSLYPFVPVAIIGEFTENPTIAEKSLSLGVTVIKLPVSDYELETILVNLSTYSLAKKELWQEEYSLSISERKKKILFLIAKIVGIIISVGTLFFASSMLYNYTLSSGAKLFKELNLGYLTPTDIALLNNSYIISDWSIKNLFEYTGSDDNLINMYIPENKFNSITSFSKFTSQYVITSSVFDDKIYIYQYPDFSRPIKNVVLLANTSVISLHYHNNNLYLIDNKKGFYIFRFDSIDNIVFLSSTTIKDFFPIDVFVYNDKIYFLDTENKIYKYDKELKLSAIIDLGTFFVEKQKFVSIAINDRWIYLLAEKEKKGYKLPTKILL